MCWFTLGPTLTENDMGNNEANFDNLLLDEIIKSKSKGNLRVNPEHS
jgi:hypothetical protein